MFAVVTNSNVCALFLFHRVEMGLRDLSGRKYQGRGTCRTWPDRMTPDLSSCQSCLRSHKIPKGPQD